MMQSIDVHKLAPRASGVNYERLHEPPDEICNDASTYSILMPKTDDRDLYVRDGEHLDAFLTRLYEFYSHGGMVPFALAKITHLLRLIFTGILFFFVGACIDYTALWKALSGTPSAHQHVSLIPFVHYVGLPVWTYPLAVAFVVYGLLLSYQTVNDVRGMFTVRDFYQLELKIRHLGTIDWATVARRAALSPELRRNGLGHSTLDLVSRVLRRSNFFVALVSLDVLAIPKQQRTCLTQPWNPLFARSTPPQCAPNERDDDAYYYERRSDLPVHPVFTQTLQWALDRTLFSFAFVTPSILRPELSAVLRRRQLPGAREKQNENNAIAALAQTLATRFRVLAVFGFLFSPFVLCYMIVEFVLENGERWRNRPQNALGMRNWSNEARWTFRDYNELPHLFRRRMARAYAPAVRYTSNFASPTTTVVSRFVAYCAGSIVLALLCFGLLYDDDVLTRVDVFVGRSGLWWIGVLGALLAFFRALIPDENDVFEPKRHLSDVAMHTHFFPRSWVDREHTALVREDFFRLFEYRWWSSFRELLSVLYTPYLLWSVLPERAEAMIRFILDNTIDEPGVGYVCRFAALRVDRDGDPAYGGGGGGSVQKQTPCSLSRPEQSPEQHGKLESSLLNFCEHYPDFRPDVRNSQFLNAHGNRSSTCTNAGASENATLSPSPMPDSPTMFELFEHGWNSTNSDNSFEVSPDDQTQQAIAQVLNNVRRANGEQQQSVDAQ